MCIFVLKLAVGTTLQKNLSPVSEFEIEPFFLGKYSKLKRNMRPVIYLKVPSSGLSCLGFKVLKCPELWGHFTIAAFIGENLLLSKGISQHFLLIM